MEDYYNSKARIDGISLLVILLTIDRLLQGFGVY